MGKKEIKAKILNMVYKEDHIFVMETLDLENNQKAKLAMRAEDFGIPREIKMPDGTVGNIPSEVIKTFCDNMIGKEKNITIQEDNYRGYSKNPSEAEINSLHDYMDCYPYKELIKEKLNED